MRIVFDIETNGLINTWLDYTKYPLKFKEGFKLHCLVAKDIDTGRLYKFHGDTIKDIPAFFSKVTTVIAHNGINFDLLVLRILFDMEFTVGPDTIQGNPVDIIDTLVLSRVLNPDRKGGHSLKSWGKRTKVYKDDFSESTDWQEFSQAMLEYCVSDVEANHATYNALLKEMGKWDWSDAIELEKGTQYITTLQEHFGFYFDTDLAEKCVAELTEWLDDIETRVEPQLPKKPISKVSAKDFTPPKRQFKADGSISSYMQKFIDKHDGEYLGDRRVKLFGKVHDMPLPNNEPLVKEEPMLLSNQGDIKRWLVGEGWRPKVWAEKDMTLDSKKAKLPRDKYIKSALRYVEETLGSPYEKYRCMRLKCRPYQLKAKLLNHDINKPLKVYTAPKYTINQEKEVDPSLIAMGETYEFIGDVVKWLTYRHRRNSILSDNGSGFLTCIRDDHRIPTPANSCGASTSRYQHKLVCNIPRTTSLYGDKMRALFGATPGNYQVGYDAAGLEARIEGHYTIQFDGEEYAAALTASKPHDIHTVLAAKNGITRDEQKTLKYAITYGAQEAKIASQTGWSLERAKEVFTKFWESAAPLKTLKDRVVNYWKKRGDKKFVLGIDGRKLWVRSQHSILNIIFQSAGVICCKRANLIHHKYMREAGLLFDPFKDSSLEGKAHIQIHYHK